MPAVRCDLPAPGTLHASETLNVCCRAGDNRYGELGNGAPGGGLYTTPVKVAGGHTFLFLGESMILHTCAIASQQAGPEGNGRRGAAAERGAGCMQNRIAPPSPAALPQPDVLAICTLPPRTRALPSSISSSPAPKPGPQPVLLGIHFRSHRSNHGRRCRGGRCAVDVRMDPSLDPAATSQRILTG